MLVAIRTQQEVAELLGVTRSAVANVESRALLKLRRVLNERGFGGDANVPDLPQPQSGGVCATLLPQGPAQG